MVANCDVLVTQYSSTAFVGLALGKEVHSYFDLAELRRLLPVQNRAAARRIAAVCRELLAGGGAATAALGTEAPAGKRRGLGLRGGSGLRRLPRAARRRVTTS